MVAFRTSCSLHPLILPFRACILPSSLTVQSLPPHPYLSHQKPRSPRPNFFFRSPLITPSPPLDRASHSQPLTLLMCTAAQIPVDLDRRRSQTPDFMYNEPCVCFLEMFHTPPHNSVSWQTSLDALCARKLRDCAAGEGGEGVGGRKTNRSNQNQSEELLTGWEKFESWRIEQVGERGLGGTSYLHRFLVS